jgi:CRP/FNR family transcriptional regulator, dissimilatory nitrate respiration regulator
MMHLGRFPPTVTFLQSFDEDLIHTYFVDGSFSLRRFGRGEVVHFVGETCESLELILGGVIVIERTDELGGISTVAVFREDDLLGGNLLFSTTARYPMTVTSRTESEVLVIRKDRLLRMFEENQDFLCQYLRYVSDHVMILGDRIRFVENTTIRNQVLRYLASEAKSQGRSRITLPISKKELAQRFGIQRTSLSRELARMRDDGLINFYGKQIELTLAGEKIVESMAV